MYSNISIKLVVTLCAMVFISILGYRNISIQKSNGTKPDTTQQITSLPKLIINKGDIIRSDTHEAIQLKGIASDALRIETANVSTDKLTHDIAQAKQWGANLIGLFILPSKLDAQRAKLDLAIDVATRLHMYVYLMPIVNTPEFHPSTHIDHSLDTYCMYVANRYKNNTNILYGMGAEPFNISGTLWRERQIELATIIRKENPDAPLLITGVDYGRNFRYTDTEDFPFTNTIYFLVDYKAENKNSISTENPVTEYVFAPYLSHRAIIMGEFGGVWKNDFGSDEDLYVIESYLHEMNNQFVSYSFYRNEAFEGNTYEGLGIYTASGILTKRGELLVSDLKNYPPTQFEPTQ